MALPFRVIDSGVRDGRAQIAFDQALIDLHREGRVPDTVRFLRFKPCALIGRHQVLSHEVRVAHCNANGIGLVRRITGGGAIYLDEGQVGWEIVLSRSRLPLGTLADYTRRICEAAAAGLTRAFAIDARYRPRNDIEVDGRKIGGTGGFFDGDTLFFQGTVLVDVDAARMLACLNIPGAPTPAPAGAAPRVTTLKELLGGTAPDVFSVHEALLDGFRENLGITFTHEASTDEEEAYAARLLREEIGTDDFVQSIDAPGGAGVLEATRRTPGGKVTAYVRLEGEGTTRRIRELVLTGDFFALPPRTILDLEAALRGIAVAEVRPTIGAHLASAKPDVLTVSADDLAGVIEDAMATAGA